MIDKLKNALRSLGHDIELYATLVVCVFLLILKMFHVAGEEWISSAILVTLMLLAMGNLKDRFADKALRQTLQRLAAKDGDGDGVRWYTRRAEATDDMFADMGRFRHLVFLGISHRRLQAYLRDFLQDGTKPLLWESIEIYFASDVVGEIYEGSEFARNLIVARHEIAELLTAPGFTGRLSRLKSISFFQQSSFATHTGSMFGPSKKELAVIYIVHSAIHLCGDTRDGLTIRLSAKQGLGDQDARFEHYADAYGAMSESAVGLGVYACSVWDRSAARWKEYARQSKVLEKSALVLADMLSPQPGDILLDLGSGSGDAAAAVLKRHPSATVVAVDGSPQMVRLLRDRFGKDRQVSVGLCRLPPQDGDDIDFRGHSFSFVVVHQSLGDFLEAFGGLDAFATWCSERLLPNGQILVAAHNSLVSSIAPPKGFETWTDPLRIALASGAKKAGYTLRRQNPLRISGEAVEMAFAKHGFSLAEHRQVEFELTYEERRRLWLVPAVMDSLIDLSKPGTQCVNTIVDHAVSILHGKQTMPRTVSFWRFKRPSSSSRTGA